jgi:osmoprotectant transport system substrate-binding protein
VIAVGSFAFSESVLLAEIYSQALEAGGYRVDRTPGLGPREFVGPALSVSLIEPLPGYAGSTPTVRSLDRTRPSADVATTHNALGRAVAGTEASALAGAPAQNSNTFVVTAATAERYDFDALSDLAAVAGELSFGGLPEWERRPLSLLGLGERHGPNFAEVVSSTRTDR